MKDICRNYLKSILPALFMAYVGCILAFTHVHVVNGVTIIHSHPYHLPTDGHTGHEHTLSFFQLLQQLSVLQITGGLSAAFALKLFLAFLRKQLSRPVYPDHLLPILGPASLRAPPMF